MPEKADLGKTGKVQEKNVPQVLGMDAQQVAALLMIGHTLYSQGRLEDARKIFDGMAVIDPRNPYVHGILGAIYQKQKEYEMAIAHYSVAIKIYPQNIPSRANRGEVYLKVGMLKEAAADFKVAIELDPDKKHPAANRARMLVALTQQALTLARQKPEEAVKKNS